METPDVANDLFKEGQKTIKKGVWLFRFFSVEDTTLLGFCRDNQIIMGSLAILSFRNIDDDRVS